MDIITHVPNKELICKVSSYFEGCRVKLRQGKNNVTWIMDLDGNLTNPGEWVMDLFSGSCVVSEACLLIPKNLSFVG